MDDFSRPTTTRNKGGKRRAGAHLLLACRPPAGTNGPRARRRIRQAQSLLLTATLVGSCVALAVKTLIESGSGMLLVLLALGFLASLLSVAVSISRRHIRARREQGYTTACFGCVEIMPEERGGWAAQLPVSAGSDHRAQGSGDRGKVATRCDVSALSSSPSCSSPPSLFPTLALLPSLPPPSLPSLLTPSPLS